MIFWSILFFLAAHVGAMEKCDSAASDSSKAVVTQQVTAKADEKTHGSLAKLIIESKALDNIWLDPSKKPTESELEQQLEHYSLNKRGITDPESYLTKLNQLRIIQLGVYGLKRFDHQALIKITHLDLSDNKLASLDGIESLPVVYFNGCNNQLTTFPKAILGWKKTLKELNLAGNQIPKIDDFDGSFEYLQKIDMSENPLAYIPEEGLEELHKKQKGNFSIMIYNQPPKKFIVGAKMSAYFIQNMRAMIKGNADLTVKP